MASQRTPHLVEGERLAGGPGHAQHRGLVLFGLITSFTRTKVVTLEGRPCPPRRPGDLSMRKHMGSAMSSTPSETPHPQAPCGSACAAGCEEATHPLAQGAGDSRSWCCRAGSAVRFQAHAWQLCRWGLPPVHWFILACHCCLCGPTSIQPAASRFVQQSVASRSMHPCTSVGSTPL